MTAPMRPTSQAFENKALTVVQHDEDGTQRIVLSR